VLRALSDSAPTPAMRVTTDTSPEAWDAFVAAHPEATGYHRWAWKGVFERGLGQRTHYLAAIDGNTVRGVLPLVEVRSWLFGRALSSLPYVNYGGVLADDPIAAAALLDAALTLARRLAVTDVLLRHRRRQFPALLAAGHKVTMLLRLAGTSGESWTALDKKVRNQVRKGEKSGVAVDSGSIELLDDFYAVFARNMRDLGTPVYGRQLFADILSTFSAEARLHVARVDGLPVAAAMSLQYRDVMEVPSASSLRAYRPLCPGHVLYWSLIRHAIDGGCRLFDFGRSTPGDGTFHFKAQWGSVPHQLWWECAGVAGLPRVEVNPRDGRFGLGVAIWKRLPLAVATRLGPHLVRRVP
jgi:FemAB-related protein (PEP-CTERM system-associated)